MRALFIGMDWFPNCQDGGLNRYFYEQVQTMPRIGVGGMAVVSSIQAGQSAPLDLRQMAPAGAPLWQRLKGARCQIRAAIEDGIRIVNAHFALYAWAGLGCLPDDAQLIAHFHGPFAEEIIAESSGLSGRLRARFARHVELRVLRRANKVITLSEAFARIARDRYQVPPDRIHVIPGGVDLTRYLNIDRAEARARLCWPTNRPVLLCVRRLARRMGIEGLIDAISQVRRTHPNVLLMIGGKGGIMAELQEQIRRESLEQNVRLLGFIAEADLPHVYAAADLAIVPTISLEGFGLVTAEALASGTPVLGTPIGGTPEILAPLDPNLVFRSARSADMAERIDDVLSSRLRLPDPGQCRAYARRYGWDEVSGRIKRVFEEASRS